MLGFDTRLCREHIEEGVFMLLQWTCFRLDGEYNEDLTVPNKKPNQTRSKTSEK